MTDESIYLYFCDYRDPVKKKCDDRVGDLDNLVHNFYINQLIKLNAKSIHKTFTSFN